MDAAPGDPPNRTGRRIAPRESESTITSSHHSAQLESQESVGSLEFPGDQSVGSMGSLSIDGPSPAEQESSTGPDNPGQERNPARGISSLPPTRGAPKAEPVTFSRGDNVEARHQGTTLWMKAKVRRAHSDGTVDVKFADTSKEDKLPPHFVRLPGAQAPPEPQPQPELETEPGPTAAAEEEDDDSSTVSALSGPVVLGPISRGRRGT